MIEHYAGTSQFAPDVITVCRGCTHARGGSQGKQLYISSQQEHSHGPNRWPSSSRGQNFTPSDGKLALISGWSQIFISDTRLTFLRADSPHLIVMLWTLDARSSVTQQAARKAHLACCRKTSVPKALAASASLQHRQQRRAAKYCVQGSAAAEAAGSDRHALL